MDGKGNGQHVHNEVGSILCVLLAQTKNIVNLYLSNVLFEISQNLLRLI